MKSCYSIDVYPNGFILTVKLMTSPCGLKRFDLCIILYWFSIVFFFSPFFIGQHY